MKRNCWFLACISLLLTFLVITVSLAQDNPPALIQRISPSVLVLLTYDEKGETLGQGSGFFINERGNIITNRHVLDGAIRAEVKTVEGRTYGIDKILATDEEGDLALCSIKIPFRAVRPLKIASIISQVGERVIVIGSPLRLEQTVTDGIVSAIREIPNLGKILQITAPLSPGSSGSPVVNLRGEVIGIASFQMVEGQNLNFAIPAERIGRLAPGRGKTLSEWQTDRRKKGMASEENLFLAGLACVWAEDYEKALPYFNAVIKKNPRHAEAYFKIGLCNGELGRYREAIAAYQRAIRLNPDDAMAYHNLGLAYLTIGDRRSALQEWRILKDLDKESADDLFKRISP